MRWNVIALVFFSLLVSIQSVCAEDRAIKAATPVEVSIYPVTSVSAGQVSTFTVRATSSIPSNDFVIEILPVEGAQVLSGSLRWQGSITPGESRELSVTLRFANNGTPSVSVTASIQPAGVAQFAATATYRQQTSTPTAFQRLSTERKVSRKGLQVIEYRVR